MSKAYQVNMGSNGDANLENRYVMVMFLHDAIFIPNALNIISPLIPQEHKMYE